MSPAAQLRISGQSARGSQDYQRPKYAHAQREAIQLVQLAETQDAVYDPGDDFQPASAHGEFVYSAPEIARVYDRRNRLDRASEVANHPGGFKKAT